MKTPSLNFPYILRQSQKAKRININITVEKGVELVYPLNMSKKSAIEFLQQKQVWVMKHEHIWKILAQPIKPPLSIHLKAMGECWSVCYENTCLNSKKTGELIIRPNQSLVYVGREDIDVIRNTLKRWCLTKAKSYLRSRISHLSEVTGLSYQRVIFRSQKTRWGSCSSEKVISLNTKLMFLEASIVDYVIIHELAHTQHLNHGTSFWKLVERWVPDFEKYCKSLRKNNNLIPAWFLMK